MKFPSPSPDRQSATMSDITNTGRGANVSAPMRKMLSPGAKKKMGYQQQQHRTFGVPLEELVRQAVPYKIPFIVKKLCTFIEHFGLECEGLFRVNGNARVVEKLKASFDKHGDANIEDDSDVMAVASLLKLFLRELPESVIPEHMTRQFVVIQEENQRNPAECSLRLKHLLKDIPDENYELLKYLMRFLAIVTCKEGDNKMSPMALAIVFGPNLFRCGNGFLALRDQGTTNQIVYRFIADYNNLFKELNEDSPAVYLERKENNIVPPRPPPPKFHIEEVEIKSPVPVPRKSKMRGLEGSPYFDHDDQDHSESSISSRGRNSGSLHSPAFSDDEMTGRISPFHLDSDGGFSMVESPVPSARTSEFVEKAIKATVIENLFGDESSLLNASIDTTIREDGDTTGSHNMTLAVEAMTEMESSGAGDGSLLPIKDRIKQFEDTDQTHESPVTKPGKHKPHSKAFEMFEKKGILITQMHGMGDMAEPEAKDRRLNEGVTKDPAGFEDVRRNSDPLQSFKRPAGPPNRRSPSRVLRQGSAEEMEQKFEGHGSNVREVTEVITNGHDSLEDDDDEDDDDDESNEDVNHNQAKSRFAFLDIRHDVDEPSADKSPTNNRKPFIPPLDFSTLHEQIGGQEPIPAQMAGTVSYQRANFKFQQQEEEEDDNTVLSPRANKVKRKAGLTMDTDMPPSPPVSQDQYKTLSHGSTDDEMTSKMKHLTKKIQALKKRIKLFEETFERENGYKPSHAEKAARPEVKKHMAELNKARKEVKKLKEEAEMGNRSRHGSGASSTGERTEPPEKPPTMAQTLDLILKKLKEKRKEAHRPEDIELMVHEQVQDEKLAVQKALLHFEGLHGRPKTKDEKDLMRPVYDRYRTIKRLLSRQPMSPRELELQTVPEDQPIEIPMQRPAKFSEPILVEPIHVPTAEAEEEDEVGMALGTTDFTVTREFGALRNVTRPMNRERRGGHSPKVKRKLDLQEDQENQNTTESNLHELSASELHDQLLKSRNVKKKLRKTLRDFEEDFIRQNGSKVGRDDRLPMQAEYNEYKQLKARLKLLEALLSKHHQSLEC